MKKLTLTFLAVLCAGAVQAASTPAAVLEGYRAEAVQQQPGFQPSTRRGGAFYSRAFGVSAKLPACQTCHTANPAQGGRHAVTDKPIKPLAPSGNAERFTDPAKVEKWFRRNCTEVVGRECTAAEKADFISFLIGVR